MVNALGNSTVFTKTISAFKLQNNNQIKEPILWRQPENIKSVKKDELILSDDFRNESELIELPKGERIEIVSGNYRSFIYEWDLKELGETYKAHVKDLIEKGETPIFSDSNASLAVILKYIDYFGDDELKAMFDDGLIKIRPFQLWHNDEARDVRAAMIDAQKNTFKSILKSIEAEFYGKIRIENFDEMWKEIYLKAKEDADTFSLKEWEDIKNGVIIYEYDDFEERISKNLSKNIVDYVTDLYKESGLGSEEYNEKIKTAISKGFDKGNNILRVANIYKESKLNRDDFLQKIRTAICKDFDAGYLKTEEKANNFSINLPAKRFRPDKTKDIIQYTRDIYKEKPPEPVDVSMFIDKMGKWSSRFQQLIDEDLFISYANRWRPRDSW